VFPTPHRELQFVTLLRSTVAMLLLGNQSFSLAAQSAVALVVSHALCCGIVMHHDLGGKWGPYQLHPKRSVSVQDYMDGAKSFVADLIFLFLPFMTLCYSFRAQAIVGT
jgi:hypothetical protein